jgi:hypothetical protein
MRRQQLKACKIAVAVAGAAKVDARSNSKEVDAKLRAAIAAGAAVRVHHVECLRVAGAHDALKASAHVHDVPLATAARRRYDARAHRHGLQRAQHAPVRGAALAPHRVPAALAVAVRAPHLLLNQLPAAAGAAAIGCGRGAREGAGALGAVTLERDADEARGHLAHQRCRGRGELEQHRGARARVHLEREVYVAAAVAVERAREPRSEPDLPVPPGDGRGKRRAQPGDRRATLLAALLRWRWRLVRRGYEVLRVERRAAGGERHGRLVLVVGLRALAGAVLRAGRGAMAAALDKNRPLEVPPGEGEGGLVRAPRHDGPHGS